MLFILSTLLQIIHRAGWSTAGVADSNIIQVLSFISIVPYKPSAWGFIKVCYEAYLYSLVHTLVCLYLVFLASQLGRTVRPEALLLGQSGQLYSALSFLRLVHKGTRSGFHSSQALTILLAFQTIQWDTSLWPRPSWWS